MPQGDGRVVLSPMLSRRGRLIGDFTVSRLGPERFLLLGAGPMQLFHLRWFAMNLPADGSVAVDNVSARWCGLQIAGPQARALLQRVTGAAVNGNDFPFLSARTIQARPRPPTIAMRVS